MDYRTMTRTLRSLLDDLSPCLDPDTARSAATDLTAGEYGLCLNLLVASLVRHRIPITGDQLAQIQAIVAGFRFEQQPIDPAYRAYPYLTDGMMATILVHGSGTTRSPSDSAPGHSGSAAADQSRIRQTLRSLLDDLDPRLPPVTVQSIETDFGAEEFARSLDQLVAALIADDRLITEEQFLQIRALVAAFRFEDDAVDARIRHYPYLVDGMVAQVPFERRPRR